MSLEAVHLMLPDICHITDRHRCSQQGKPQRGKPPHRRGIERVNEADVTVGMTKREYLIVRLGLVGRGHQARYRQIQLASYS